MANNKPWWRSMGVWGGLLAFITALGAITTGAAPSELIQEASKWLEKIWPIFAGVALIGIRRAMGLK